MSKIYISLITSKGNAQYFDWYNMTSKYVDGLAITWHGEKDEGYDILDNNKGDGFIEQIPYMHHGHSMNHWLFNSKIRPGSWFLIRDTLEQATESFLSQIKKFITNLEGLDINSVYQYSKLLLFKKYEDSFFTFHPHWTLQNAHDKKIRIEELPGFDDPRKYCYSIRNDVRPKDEFIEHFMRYTLADHSNNMLLGNENNISKYKLEEELRQRFKKYVNETLDVELNSNSIKQHILTNGADYRLKWFFNQLRYLNDWYCYYILNHSLDDILKRNEKKELFKI